MHKYYDNFAVREIEREDEERARRTLEEDEKRRGEDSVSFALIYANFCAPNLLDLYNFFEYLKSEF